MARALLITLGLVLLTSSCMTLTSPSEPGIAAYRSGDMVNAYSQLAPLAKSNDPAAQYYAARIILEKQPPSSRTEQQEAIAWVLASAGAGNSSAYSLVLALAMPPEQRGKFLKSITFKRFNPAELSNRLVEDSQLTAASRITYDAMTIALIEQTAGGPVPLSSLSEIAENIAAIENGALAAPSSPITDDQLMLIDEKLAQGGQQFAQARIAKRYAMGRGVEKDLKRSFQLNLRAAKSRPAPRSCVYQAPVGSGSGSTYCYDTGQPSPGLPRAILEVCKSYAFGLGIEKNARKAQDWCELAEKSGETRIQANQVLRSLAAK